MGTNIIFQITEEDLQNEAMERVGRKITCEEIEMAKKWIKEGIGGIALSITYSTVFTEMIKK